MRKALHFILFVPLFASLVSLTAVMIQPEERIKMSAMSDHILLVEIAKVTIGEEEVADGIGYRKVAVKGKILETVRGVAKDKQFHGTARLIRVIDGNAYQAVHGGVALDGIHAAAKQRKGIEDCKPGGRCLVILSPFGELYVEVKDGNDWKSKILKRKYLPWEKAASPKK